MKLSNERMLEKVYQLNATDKKIKWDEIFESEEEMLDKMLKFKELDFKIMKNNSVNNNIWLKMIEKAKKFNWKLSEKQIKQVKRNAYLIVRQYNFYNEEERQMLLDILNS